MSFLSSTQNCRRRSLTLVEVVAAALILATVATAALSASSSSLMGLHASADRLIAQHLARSLIADWRVHAKDSMISGSGSCAEWPEWRWSREVKPMALAHANGVHLVTLTLKRENSVVGTNSAPFTWTWAVRDETR